MRMRANQLLPNGGREYNDSMSTNQHKNDAAFRNAQDELAKRFPLGHFVAFDNGNLIADAPSFDELTQALAAIGKDSPDVFVAQTGIDYPVEVYILMDR